MTPKQEQFIAEYLVDLNGTQAAIRVGYSKRTAQPIAARLLSNVMISQEIARRQKERLAKVELTATGTLEQLKAILHSDIRSFIDGNGALKPVAELTAEQAASISSIEVILKNAQAGDGVIDRVLKIRLWDKVRAIEMAMKHFSLLVEKLDITVHSDEITK